MTQDKIFNLFLIDGTYQGRISCTAENWAGIAFKIPKNQIKNCFDIKELERDGIYFLFSESAVYIGAGKIESRDDFWEDAIFFTNSKNYFETTSLKFLKDKFLKLAAAANHYEIKSKRENFSNNISAEKTSRLEIFAEYVETILYFLGYKIFERPKETQTTEKIKGYLKSKIDENTIFTLKKKIKETGITVEAKGKKVSTGFVVLAGSQISPARIKKYSSDEVKSKRRTAKISNEKILLEDVHFKSPSGAAAFITGGSEDGPEVWKNEEGITLKEILKRLKDKEKQP